MLKVFGTTSPKFIFTGLLIFALFLVKTGSVFASDTTPPETAAEYVGTVGNHGWYTSTVNTTLKATDLEAGPASTVYWLDSQDPVTYNYTTGENQIINPSFENGFLLSTIYNWSHVPNNWLFFWRTFLEHKFGFRSAATGLFGNGLYYWHNRDDAVAVEEGQTYTASGWVKTVELWGEAGAWFEVWAKGAGDVDTDVKIQESVERIRGASPWRMLTRTFVVPSGYTQVYLRLYTQDTGFLGVSFWDGVSIHRGYEYSVNFTVVENGPHTFHYYSIDNSGNVEATHTAPLNIDTISPQNWRNFDQSQEGNDHTFKAMIDVRDITSGVDTGTAQYAYYTDHQGQEWDHNGDGVKDWYNVASVKRVDNGAAAGDGYTGYVTLNTPAIDFGNSATIMKVQLRIVDMAGNLSDSPVQMILGPWIKVSGQGNFNASGGIVMQTFPPLGETNTDSLVITGDASQINFLSSKPWILNSYTTGEKHTLADFVDKYDLIRSQALPLPTNKLPTQDGIYYYTGNYTIDNNSIPAGFSNNTFSAIIIIEGNVTIKNNITIQPGSAVLFLVTGNVEIWGQVDEIDGFFINQGNFDTNINLQGKQTLTIKGGVACGQSLLFTRDLGRKGAVNNENTPSEIITYQPKYAMNPFLLKYLGSGNLEVDWREVDPAGN